MNSYPSWIHRIPEILEALGNIETDLFDRQQIEQLFDLRRTAANDLLRRMGAVRVGNSYTISRRLLVARLKQAMRHPDYQVEIDRRLSVARQIGNFRRALAGRAKVEITKKDQQLLAQRSVASLPATVRIEPGRLELSCADMDDLLRQLLAVIQAIDSDYDRIQEIIESRKDDAKTRRQ